MSAPSLAGSTAPGAAVHPRLSLRERFDLRRFFRGDRPVPGPVVLSHQRVFILPTRPGLGMSVLLVIQWLAAINYGNNLAFILTFLLAAIGLVGMLHCFRNLSGLTVGPSENGGEAVFVGDAAQFAFAVKNPSALPRQRVALRLGKGTSIHIDLPGDDTTTVRIPIAATRRGWLRPETLTVSTQFPLGLFHAWSPLNFSAALLVYPAPAKDAIAFPSGGSGGRVRPTQSGDEEFRGFDSYRPGDSLKDLHWKGIAKGQAPQVRRYSGEEAENLQFDWVTTPGNGLEERLSRLCRWVLDAERAGLRYGLRLPGQNIPTGLGAEHRRRCLEALALFGL